MEPKNPNSSEIVDLLRDLRLKHFCDAFEKDIVDVPETAREMIITQMTKWARHEQSGRQTQLIAAKIKTAKFRQEQTVDTFNFKHNKVVEKIEKTYLTLVAEISKENLPSAVFSGTAGLGKTHLARALGYAACQKGLSVLFITAAELVNRLQHAQKTFNLELELNKYRRPQVLIIDELGYVSLDTPSSNLFFQVISSRHDQKLGTITTTNLSFGKFNQIFANDAIAHAIVDRLVNDAEVFYLEGVDSYRPHQRTEKMKRKKDNA
jgi:DNA replication protein DnaC